MAMSVWRKIPYCKFINPQQQLYCKFINPQQQLYCKFNNP